MNTEIVADVNELVDQCLGLRSFFILIVRGVTDTASAVKARMGVHKWPWWHRRAHVSIDPTHRARK